MERFKKAKLASILGIIGNIFLLIIKNYIFKKDFKKIYRII